MKVRVILPNGKEIYTDIDEKFLLKEENQKPNRARKGEKYYYKSDLGEVEPSWDEDDFEDNVRYENANYFLDGDSCENLARARVLEDKLRRFSEEVQEHKIGWDNKIGEGLLFLAPSEQKKYYICFDYFNKTLYWSSTFTHKVQGTVYFDTKEHCEMAIECFHDELIWYFTRCEVSYGRKKEREDF